MQNLIRTFQHAIATKNGSTLITQNMNTNILVVFTIVQKRMH